MSAKRFVCVLVLIFVLSLLVGCAMNKAKGEFSQTTLYPTWTINPDVDQLVKMNKQFVDVELAVSLDGYSSADLEFLLVKQTLDDGARRGGLSKAETLARRLVMINYGRFNCLDKHRPFIGQTEKPLGGTFYPFDLTQQEFENWVKAHPDTKEAFEDPYTVIRRSAGKLVAVPYAEFYHDDLAEAAGYLIAAAKVADSPSLADFLVARAEAFRSNNYRPSDERWVQIEGSKFEVVIGPYETYGDRLLGYKAAFEAYIAMKDPVLSADLSHVRGYLDEMERKIPLDDQYRGYKRAGDSPIFVVDVFCNTGDGRCGVQASAFNLPNDEYVRKTAGTKNVMLRNVQRAKFRLFYGPIAKVVLVDSQQALVTWGAYFWHNILHELAHGMGPGIIKAAGVETTVSKTLKDTYLPLEELKADALGFYFAAGYLVDVGFFQPNMLDETAVQSLAGFFRSVRFGADEAHGVNNLMLYNYLRAAGVYEYDSQTQRYNVNISKFLPTVTALAHEVLTIEAIGDYAAAKAFMARYGKMPPEAKTVLVKLNDIPVDICPLYPSADALMLKHP